MDNGRIQHQTVYSFSSTAGSIQVIPGKEGSKYVFQWQKELRVSWGNRPGGHREAELGRFNGGDHDDQDAFSSDRQVHDCVSQEDLEIV